MMLIDLLGNFKQVIAKFLLIEEISMEKLKKK